MGKVQISEFDPKQGRAYLVDSTFAYAETLLVIDWIIAGFTGSSTTSFMSEKLTPWTALNVSTSSVEVLAVRNVDIPKKNGTFTSIQYHQWRS